MTNKKTNSKPDKKTNLLLQALNTLRQKLLDLTTRNRLLNYKESVRSISIISESPNDIFDMLIIESKNLELTPTDEIQNDDEEDEDKHGQLSLIPPDNHLKNNRYNVKSNSIQNNSISNIAANNNKRISKKVLRIKRHNQLQAQLPPEMLERRCKRLLSESRTAIEETGSNLLHLAIGFLEWYDDDSSSEVYRAPLILIPARIEKAQLDRRTNCYNYFNWGIHLTKVHKCYPYDYKGFSLFSVEFRN